MKKALLWLLIATLPAHAAMDITRELDAPALLVPGQPVRVAVTYWTDSWFNPPPEWPDFAVKNGELLSTPLPSQLVTRKRTVLRGAGSVSNARPRPGSRERCACRRLMSPWRPPARGR